MFRLYRFHLPHRLLDFSGLYCSCPMILKDNSLLIVFSHGAIINFNSMKLIDAKVGISNWTLKKIELTFILIRLFLTTVRYRIVFSVKDK